MFLLPSREDPFPLVCLGTGGPIGREGVLDGSADFTWILQAVSFDPEVASFFRIGRTKSIALDHSHASIPTENRLVVA